MSALAEVADRLRAEGGLLAEGLGPVRPAADPDVPARLAVAVEAIREGYLLHYGTGRLLGDDVSEDLALLAGDRLYALGLEELAAAGDLAAVRVMAELIARCATAHARRDAAAADRAWEMGTLALAVDR